MLESAAPAAHASPRPGESPRWPFAALPSVGTHSVSTHPPWSCRALHPTLPRVQQRVQGSVPEQVQVQVQMQASVPGLVRGLRGWALTMAQQGEVQGVLWPQQGQRVGVAPGQSLEVDEKRAGLVQGWGQQPASTRHRPAECRTPCRTASRRGCRRSRWDTQAGPRPRAAPLPQGCWGLGTGGSDAVGTPGLEGTGVSGREREALSAAPPGASTHSARARRPHQPASGPRHRRLWGTQCAAT